MRSIYGFTTLTLEEISAPFFHTFDMFDIRLVCPIGIRDETRRSIPILFGWDWNPIPILLF